MYLLTSDFKRVIQTDNLTQIIAGDNTILSNSINTAVEELTSYLIQKYDLVQELQDIPAWVKTNVYNASNRVYMTAPAFSASTIYTTGQYVVNAGFVYRSIAGSAAHAFNVAEWTLICDNNQIFYAKFPQPFFNVYAPYKAGDKVFWKDKVYTCLKASVFPTFPPDIQISYYEQTPLPNVFPDDTKNGPTYWGAGVAYTVPANTEISNTTYWVLGDNRSQQLVTYCIDIALYHIHSRIAPMNIPDLRVKRYDDAKSWLKNAAKGDDITANLPVKQPRQGGRIRFGGPTKNQNSY